MNNYLYEITQLCTEILTQARLMTAYSGQIDQFLFPQEQNWYVDQNNCAVGIHYTPNVFAAGLTQLSVPDQDFAFWKLLNRISASKMNRYQFDYLLNLERNLNQLRTDYIVLKQAHQSIANGLREVNRFLSSGNESFKINKLAALRGLKFSIEEFEKNPILNGSYCEKALIKINQLILMSENPPELDRNAALYCFTLNVLLEKISTLVQKYEPMGPEVFANPALRKIIRSYPLLGLPRSMAKQHIDIVNETLEQPFELKQKEFTTLMTSLMLCYSDALLFPENLQKYIAGDQTAIDFEALMNKSKLDLSKTNIVRGNLVEGELYQQLDLAASFDPIFQHYKIS